MGCINTARMEHTPFFPQWRNRLAPMGPRVRKLRQQSLMRLELLFAGFIGPNLLSPASNGDNSRQRVFTLRKTFWGFLYQVLNSRCSCREVLRQLQALQSLHNEATVNENTSAFCQARKRLPLDLLKRIRCKCAGAVRKKGSGRRWKGLDVKVIDGTSTSLPDTPQNQKAYPQPGSQKPGCGFPLMKLVGVFGLFDGVLLDYAKGNHKTHEMAILHKLLGIFGAGDLALGDRGFNSYTLLALLLQRGTQSLFRLHQARKVDLRQGKRLGRNDRLIVWRKPVHKPVYIPCELWNTIPEELPVRIVRYRIESKGFRSREITLATTLTDASKYPAGELAGLYGLRWRIELWFRDIKTSMGMETLRCKSPAMAHKEVEMYFIAYNLIRALMAQSATIHDVALERLSFKGSVDSTRQYSVAIAQAPTARKQKELYDELIRVIARDKVPERPGRREPRAVKRRPKPYPYLTKNRKIYKEIPHRSKYRKNDRKKHPA